MIKVRSAAIEAADTLELVDASSCSTGLIMFLFLVRFLGREADQGPVIGRDVRRGLCGPKAPHPRSAVLPPRGYL